MSCANSERDVLESWQPETIRVEPESVNWFLLVKPDEEGVLLPRDTPSSFLD